MLRLIIACAFALLHSYSNAQNEQSAPPAPAKSELTSSTPMPRVNGPFFVSINIKKLRENMYESMAPKIKNAKVTNNGAAELQLLSITPEKTGPFEIGPVEYVVNNIKYTTNRLVVQVAEELPYTDTGLWISKVPVDDKEFCIIIEQRAPIESVTTKVGNYLAYQL
jgi:hypothetical protein